MEVVILEAKNPPTKPVLAMHAGSVRRQAKLEVNQPFVIPHPGKASQMEVSLFQQLGTQLLPDDGKPEATCSIPVRKSDGTATQVKIHVRRGHAQQKEDAEKGATTQFDEDPLGVTRDYIGHHHLQNRIQTLIQDVLRDQPDNPYRYMVDQLRRLKVAAADESGDGLVGIPEAVKAEKPPRAAAPPAEEPLVPRAPDQPRPADKPARPQPKGGFKPAAEPAPEAVGGPDQAPPQPTLQARAEARQIARAALRDVLKMPACMRVAEDSLRKQTREELSKSHASLILNKAKENQAAEESDAVLQARAAIRSIMRGACMRESPEYYEALTRWTVARTIRGATNLIGKEESKRLECFCKDDDRRRVSLPTPIVMLKGGESNWAAWLR